MNEQEIKQIAKYIQPKLQEFMVGDTISSLKKRIISAIKNKDIIALALSLIHISEPTRPY